MNNKTIDQGQSTQRKRSRPFVAGGSGYTKNKASNSVKPRVKKDITKKRFLSKNTTASKPKIKIPPIGDSIRIIPLGGVEEVGRNMTMIEFGDDIVVFDAGVQFTNEVTPGIDFMLPNIDYLEKNKDRVRALVVTHGHLDHTAGIPYVLDKIGNPPIYTRNLTSIMIKKRLEEIPTNGLVDMKIVEPGETLNIGKLKLKFFNVTHSIPESMGISVITPYGNVVITGDLKLENRDGVPTEKEESNWEDISKDKNLLLITDSTNVEKQGFSMSEHLIYENLEEIIKNASNRLIIGTFASQFERMIEIVKLAEKYNKKIVLEGRSIKTNMEIANLSGIFTPKEGSLIKASEIKNYPPDRILILATGAQGEEFAALMRISTKKHKEIRFTDKDTVVLSSSVIPGNEVSVRKLQDEMARNDVKIIHYRMADIHATGHGNEGDLAWINKKVGAKFFMPAYGNHSMLKVHANVAHTMAGVPKENIVVPDNGSVIEIQNKGEKIVVLKEKAPSTVMTVDGFSVGDLQEVVIRDRQMLSQDGIFIIVATINLKTGRLKKSPDIISRGFIYLRESQELLQEARSKVKKIAESGTKDAQIDFDIIKKKINTSISRFLLQKTNKRPIVIAVVLGV
ncbi:ribonuclease J [Patescibacteria group bacterium]